MWPWQRRRSSPFTVVALISAASALLWLNLRERYVDDLNGLGLSAYADLQEPTGCICYGWPFTTVRYVVDEGRFAKSHDEALETFFDEHVKLIHLHDMTFRVVRLDRSVWFEWNIINDVAVSLVVLVLIGWCCNRFFRRSSEPPKPCAWCRIHLSTALVLMVLAGGLVGANLTKRPYVACDGFLISEFYGWPYPLYLTNMALLREAFPRGFGYADYPEQWDLSVLLANVIVALSIIAVAAVICEFKRRRPIRSQK